MSSIAGAQQYVIFDGRGRWRSGNGPQPFFRSIWSVAGDAAGNTYIACALSKKAKWRVPPTPRTRKELRRLIPISICPSSDLGIQSVRIEYSKTRERRGEMFYANPNEFVRTLRRSTTDRGPPR